MCGIVAAVNIDKELGSVNNEIIDQFQDQKSRGLEGFGAVIIKKDLTIEVKRATTEAKLIIDLSMEKNQSNMIFMHHRNPTSTENKLKQTHPIITDNGSMKYKYLTIHNGVIRNEDDLREEHEKLGFEYTTITMEEGYNSTYKTEKFNDSEAVAIEIARLIEGQVDGLKVEGSVAFITLQISKKTNKVKEIFFGRNDLNPLILAKSNKKIRLSSEGVGNEIKEEMLYSFNLKDFKLTKKKLIFLEETTNNTSKSKPISSYNRDTNSRIQNIDTTNEITPIEVDPLHEDMVEDIGKILDDIKDDMEKYETTIAINLQEYLSKIGAVIYQAKVDVEEVYLNEMTEKYHQEGSYYDPNEDFNRDIPITKEAL